MPIQASWHPSAEQLADVHLAPAKMHSAEGRAFLAEITLKYCCGSARQAEHRSGWGRGWERNAREKEKDEARVLRAAAPCSAGEAAHSYGRGRK